MFFVSVLEEVPSTKKESSADYVSLSKIEEQCSVDCVSDGIRRNRGEVSAVKEIENLCPKLEPLSFTKGPKILHYGDVGSVRTAGTFTI